MEKKCKPKLGQWRNESLFVTDEKKLIAMIDYLKCIKSKTKNPIYRSDFR
jgi:hypothetical protein